MDYFLKGLLLLLFYVGVLLAAIVLRTMDEWNDEVTKANGVNDKWNSY